MCQFYFSCDDFHRITLHTLLTQHVISTIRKLRKNMNRIVMRHTIDKIVGKE